MHDGLEKRARHELARTTHEETMREAEEVVHSVRMLSQLTNILHLRVASGHYEPERFFSEHLNNSLINNILSVCCYLLVTNLHHFDKAQFELLLVAVDVD